MRGRGGVHILDDAMNYFELVLDQCPVDHPDHAAALTNLAWARLQGYIRKDLQGIYITTTLLCDALALRPRGHPDRPASLYYLAEALIWRYSYHSITLCPPENQNNPSAVNKLAKAVKARFRQCGFDDLDRNVQLGREVVSMGPEGNPNRVTYLINLTVSLRSCFDYQGGSHDLDEAISLYEEALPLRPVGHEYHNASSDGLERALLIRFNECYNINDINRAASLFRKALASCSPRRSNRDTKLNNLAAALITRHDKLHAREGLDEVIDLCRKSLLLLQQDDHPERHRNLFDLSMALCSRFAQTRKRKDVEEAIGLCQDSLVALIAIDSAQSLPMNATPCAIRRNDL
ncbi:uncharacterized protein F5147DRAFT_578678 [Suillus discolor]|uniref:TPR-like protein n=1 Tax=Suillus discolor TaxID=1912936 RepID=A0A9P7F5G2_9AGAM|nr:uncharacterized protein F5147DRAFT_578678 [Suillus discolor]KAG2106768.1 hypothetical protein F5147DRAFT_578678 [Suillus discolor]